MNRNEEFESLMKELDENIPDLQPSIEKAKHRKSRKRLLYKPLGSLAAVFALFVLLVNLSPPVAYACSRVPGLRELAKAVTFSPSLSEAVNNAYVQPIDLQRSRNGIDAQVQYLIVDQKQVNVFYRLDSKNYDNLFIGADALDENGEHLPCSIVGNEGDGKLRCVCLDFGDKTVPKRLNLQMKVFSGDAELPEDAVTEESGYLAEFTFPLEFDPQFTATGKIFPMNKTVTMDGQTITIRDIEVYPTHLRVNVEEDPKNTAYLRELHFYLKTDWGMTFEPVANGITATGTADTPSMVSFRADSTYFYQAKKLELVITGAQWLQKGMEKVPLNLKSGTIGTLPHGVSLVSCEPVKDGWDVTFRADLQKANHLHQEFFSHYYDPDGNLCQMDSYRTRFEDSEENPENPGLLVTLPIRNYPYEDVFLCPTFSFNWQAENQIVLPVF